MFKWFKNKHYFIISICTRQAQLISVKYSVNHYTIQCSVNKYWCGLVFPQDQYNQFTKSKQSWKRIGFYNIAVVYVVLQSKMELQCAAVAIRSLPHSQALQFLCMLRVHCAVHPIVNDYLCPLASVFSIIACISRYMYQYIIFCGIRWCQQLISDPRCEP